MSTSTSPKACGCVQIGINGDKPVAGSITNALNANVLADSLGVSPLYRRETSARWQSAALVYKTSRSHSPVPPGDSTPQFVFPPPVPEVRASLRQISQETINTPLSLEDIANVNRRKHLELGGKTDASGALELEAIAAVHELACSVESISVSEILPRTCDLIFVNLKTVEGHPYTLELTLKGWRIASTHTDCMNGDYKQVDLHTRYFSNARELLHFISPGHILHFNDILSERLKQLETKEEAVHTLTAC
uniref:GSKIP domain-containing protein n=1 Tax=Acrobeloides nanus TaxID=290746 RepID=A0A914CFR4_9BILA